MGVENQNIRKKLEEDKGLNLKTKNGSKGNILSF